MHNPVTTIIQSTGQLKYYSFFVDSIVILCLPATWLAFHLGASSEISIILMIVMCMIAHLVRLVILRRQYPSFSYATYISGIILRGLFVAVCTFFVVYLVHQALHPGIVRLIAVFASSCITTLLTVYFLALSAKEQQTLSHFLKQRMNKFSES